MKECERNPNTSWVRPLRFDETPEFKRRYKEALSQNNSDKSPPSQAQGVQTSLV